MKVAVALVHIFFATLWLGGSFFYAVLLLPRLGVLDVASQRALRSSLRSVMTPLLAVSALATIVSGLVMMVQLHALHPGSFSHTRWGVALIVGTLASLGALAIAAFCELALRRQDTPLRRGPALRRSAASRVGPAARCSHPAGRRPGDDGDRALQLTVCCLDRLNPLRGGRRSATEALRSKF